MKTNKFKKGRMTILFTLLLCIDALVACIVSELWIRTFIPVKNICYYHDRTLGDMFCPQQHTYGYVEPGYSNIFINNSLGFHDIERIKEKKAGLLRVHIYGDSMIAGAGVAVTQTIPSFLEKYFNMHFPAQPIEAVNMASAEDSTGSELLIYRHIGRAFNPDVVIVYFMNDFHDNIFETHPRTRSPFFELDSNGRLIFIAPKPVNTNSAWERFKRWSLLYRLLANKFLGSKLYHDANSTILNLRYQVLGKKEKIKGNHLKALQIRHQFLREKAWPVTTALLKTFRDDVEKDGAHFILIDGFPITPTSAGGYINKDLARFCQQNNITYIPMYKEYQKLKSTVDKVKYFFQDSHPTPTGNQKLSKILTLKLAPLLRAYSKCAVKKTHQQNKRIKH